MELCVIFTLNLSHSNTSFIRPQPALITQPESNATSDAYSEDRGRKSNYDTNHQLDLIYAKTVCVKRIYCKLILRPGASRLHGGESFILGGRKGLPLSKSSRVTQLQSQIPVCL